MNNLDPRLDSSVGSLPVKSPESLPGHSRRSSHNAGATPSRYVVAFEPRSGSENSPAQLGDDSPHDGAPDANGDDAKRPRACESCRGLKVRCDQDPEHPKIPCKRCAKARRPCIITQPSRKRQRKADTRVAELEKKLDALTAALTQQHGAPGNTLPYAQPLPLRDPHQVVQGPNDSLEAGSEPKRRRTEPANTSQLLPNEPRSAPRTDNAHQSQPETFKDEEAISRGFHQINNAWAANSDLRRFLSKESPEDFARRLNALIEPGMGAKIFDRYVTKLAPHLPAVIFPPGTTAEQVWREKPILYLAVLSAASYGMVKPEVFWEINQEAVGAIADCVVRNGAKSLELLQAMQIMALWYKPPERMAQTNFYQIIHMGVVMGLDIGLGKRFNPAKAKRGFGGPRAHVAPGTGMAALQDSDTLEARRAWLCCYYLSASASMVLRRPNLLRWSNYMQECIGVLESHPDAPASDKLFCQHVRIQHICEDIGSQFQMDEPTAKVDITDSKVWYQLGTLQNDLKSWKENIPPDCRGLNLEFFEHVTSLYLHEIALHLNHNVDDFKLPFTEESLRSVNNLSDKLTQHHMAALEACVTAAHGILDTMLKYDLQIVPALPMLIYFVRCCYALVILIKMHVAITAPGSEVGKIMKVDDLRVEYYSTGLIALFNSDAHHHPKVIMILSLLRDFFMKHQENVQSQARGEPGPGAAKADEHTRQSSHDREGYRAPQTPLDLLSQVATDQTSQSSGKNATHADNQNWTVNSPYVMNYSRPPPYNHPDSRFPIHQQRLAGGMPANRPPLGYGNGLPNNNNNQPSNVEMNASGDYAWGVGFEQAMGMTMGGMDGLTGGGLEDWLLADNMMPFQFNGDFSAGGSWLQ